MVLHSCSVCNYHTVYTTNYKKHCQSKKHLRKLENHELNNIKVCDPQLTLFDPQQKVTDPQMTLTDPQNFLTNPKLTVDNFYTEQGGKKNIFVSIVEKNYLKIAIYIDI